MTIAMPPDDTNAAARDPRDIGLCADCEHARRIPSSRGSVFYMCAYSEIDPAYPKYPRLPVLRCAAYRQAGTT